MKVLLLCPGFYTLDKTLKLGFTRLKHDVFHYDYRTTIENWKNKTNTQIYRLPFKLRNNWETYYLSEINKLHLKKYDEYNPDIVFIYNNEMLLPETIKYFKQKSKIVFFLGDNPYYTPTNNYYLNLLTYADLIISPDSFWKHQLELIGIKNIVHDYLGFNDEINFPIKPTEAELKEFGSDVLFIGGGYVDSWGYKRTLFLSKFTDFNLKIYGTKNWIRWFKFFPAVENKFTLLVKPLSFEKVNILSNCAKVYPVDANPGLLNGLHLRIFDCIGSGILPLVEYKKDIETVFKDVEIPIIRNYNDAEAVAKKYIEDDELRINTLNKLRSFINENYKPELVIKRILGKVL